jgi:hypothetical protein
MSGQAISLATKGIICKPQEITRHFSIPLNLSIKTNEHNIHLIRKEGFKLNLDTKSENIHIVNENIGLTINTKKPVISLKACA